ncbi:hypothetical protein AS850_13570 [Frondihabitans sp. 762G35]|uniref:hypothetical protein n=1 Tax=Frondihabitans sp. 762G35 TaxID=1446794 RepID=UPI000D20FFD2|nr:hypothetical protein [Frondihabitans sp. 762G35]ARC58107.1 hypothetical protein AS850_13570 [Frondihabitans sp. 762G35]
MTVFPPAPTSHSPMSAGRLRAILSAAAWAVAGLLVGLDVLLAGVLAALLRGREAEVVQVPGILRGAWSLADGLSVEVGVGTLLVPLLGAAVGLALGLRRGVRRPGRRPGRRA